MDSAELYLDRFCGREIYPITKATWNLYFDDKLGMMNLCLHLECGRGTILHNEAGNPEAEPWWEVNVIEKDLAINSLVSGTKLSVPLDYDQNRSGHVTNFYYYEHEGSDNNTVEIVAVEEGRLLIEMVGETSDVDYYDGSKPPTRLSVRTWFVHDANTRRSVK